MLLVIGCWESKLKLIPKNCDKNYKQQTTNNQQQSLVLWNVKKRIKIVSTPSF
jgi:hypothetical protein